MICRCWSQRSDECSIFICIHHITTIPTSCIAITIVTTKEHSSCAIILIIPAVIFSIDIRISGNDTDCPLLRILWWRFFCCNSITAGTGGKNR